MPAWMHERAKHILAKNPSMPKSEAFAIATQQSHALGKSPKSYGTAAGKSTAKAKYKTPEDDVKIAMHPIVPIAALGVGTGLATMGGVMLAVGKRGRDQMSREVHDPRLYSNLRGAASLESAKERVAAHKHLKKGDHSVLEAMHEGFMRPGHKKEAGLTDRVNVVATDNPALHVLMMGANGATIGSGVASIAGKNQLLGALLGAAALAPLGLLSSHMHDNRMKMKKTASAPNGVMMMAFSDELQKIAEDSPMTLRSMGSGPSTERSPRPDMSEHAPASIRGKSQLFPEAGSATASSGGIKMTSLLTRGKPAPSGMNPGQFQPKSFSAFALRKKLAEEKDSGFMDTMSNIGSKIKDVAMTNVGGPQGILAPAGQIAANAKPRGGPSAGFLKFQAGQAAARAKPAQPTRAVGAAG